MQTDQPTLDYEEAYANDVDALRKNYPESSGYTVTFVHDDGPSHIRLDVPYGERGSQWIVFTHDTYHRVWEAEYVFDDRVLTRSKAFYESEGIVVAARRAIRYLD